MYEVIVDMYGRRTADFLSGMAKLVVLTLSGAAVYWSLVITINNNHAIVKQEINENHATVMQEINLIKQDQDTKTEFVTEFKGFMVDLNATLSQLNVTVATLNKHEEDQDRRITANERDIKALEAAD